MTMTTPLPSKIHQYLLKGELGPIVIKEATVLWTHLTQRQAQVAELLASGISSKQIAEELGISVKTLDIHRADVYTRLKVQSPAGVAMIWVAVQVGKQRPS